jgi:hypothetical protein
MVPVKLVASPLLELQAFNYLVNADFVSRRAAQRLSATAKVVLIVWRCVNQMYMSTG